jgi:hypothetical protein
VTHSFKVKSTLDPSTAFLHADGGRLAIASSTVEWAMTATVIRVDDDQACDVLRFSRETADRDGCVHQLDTHVSAYELWERMCATPCYSADAFRSSHHLSTGASLYPIIETMRFWSDGRDDRYVPIALHPKDGPDIFAVREKYLSGDVGLAAVLRPGETIDTKALTDIAIVWRTSVKYQSLLHAGTDGPAMIVNKVPLSRIIWHNHCRQGTEDGQRYWYSSAIPDPLIFRRTDRQARPNPDVRVDV